MNKQREAFEKWYRTSYPNRELFRSKLLGMEYADNRDDENYRAWQAAQADKLEFARRVVGEYSLALLRAVEKNETVYIDDIIAKVEQEQ